jgi:filamentous hemagglutinin
VQGLAGSDLKAALAGGAAPYVAEVIKQYSPNETSRVMAHAVMAGVAAELQGTVQQQALRAPQRRLSEHQ